MSTHRIDPVLTSFQLAMHHIHTQGALMLCCTVCHTVVYYDCGNLRGMTRVDYFLYG